MSIHLSVYLMGFSHFANLKESGEKRKCVDVKQRMTMSLNANHNWGKLAKNVSHLVS